MGLKKSLNEYTCSDIPQLCEEITEKYSDLLGPLLLKLPPFREVSHEIPLIDVRFAYGISPKACAQRSLCRQFIAQSFEATAKLGL